MQLSFAVIPPVYFTGQRSKMGAFVNRRSIAILSWTAVILILGLNTWLVFGALREWLA